MIGQTVMRVKIHSKMLGALSILIIFYSMFFSDAGNKRIKIWIDIWHQKSFLEKAPIPTAVDIEREREKVSIAKWVSRKYRVSYKPTKEIVNSAFNASDIFEIDAHLIIAIIAIESSFNPLAESSAGAQGLMQIMPKIHKKKFEKYGGFANILEVRTNVFVGTEILSNYYRRYGSYRRALLAYVGVRQSSKSRYPDKVLRIQKRLKKMVRS